MNILGISALDTDATAALLCDGEWVGAVSEERFTRCKQQPGFPTRAIEWVLRRAGLRPDAIDVVTYPSFDWHRERRLMRRAFWADLRLGLMEDGSWKDRACHIYRFRNAVQGITKSQQRSHEELERGLRALGLLGKLERVEHHTAHAASAFYSSGFERAVIFTLDGYGSGLSGSVSVGDAAGIRRVHAFRWPHSLGLMYADVTRCLGFRRNRHEGKVVGLAAFGDPEKLLPIVRQRYQTRPGDFRSVRAFNQFFITHLLSQHSRADVAAAFQALLEELAVGVVEYYVARFGIPSLAVAGGVTANVKMNQRLHEARGVCDFYVHPDMGDGGTALGGALHVWKTRGGGFARPAHMFQGPEYAPAEMRAALRSAALPFEEPPDIELRIAELLARKRTVARVDGRLEYGPRALGNRTIMFHCGDPNVNYWLNRALKREEFMPFAPATLRDEAHRFYKKLEGAEYTARFMTITFDCTDEMIRMCPAAVHVDGTARPQLVCSESAPAFERILRHYYRLTNIPSVINTSFNMHEEPIVASPMDAVRAFQQGKLDHLALGPYLVSRPGGEPHVPASSYRQSENVSG